jgi:hypothetical protein
VTAVLLRPASWTTRAACDGMARPDWDPWSGDQPELLEVARQVCGSCPVQDRCLDEALARGEAYGVFGGLSPGERADVARLRGLPRASPAGRWAHGTSSGYKAHGCRCPSCSDAHTRDVARWRNRPATSRAQLLVSVLDRPVGRGTHRAFPGQLVLDLGALL